MKLMMYLDVLLEELMTMVMMSQLLLLTHSINKVEIGRMLEMVER